MDFISLELNQQAKAAGEPSCAVDVVEQLKSLIRGIAIHAVESQPEGFVELQRNLSGIADSLVGDSSADDLLVAISKTLRFTEEYNRHANAIFKGQVEEHRGMVATMAETIQFVVSSSQSSVKQLGFMESQLQRASSLDDLRQLKTYTSACLTLVRRESTRLQTETREKVQELKKNLDTLSTRLQSVAVEELEDPVTGLPARPAAEQAIEDTIAKGKTCLGALFLMERLATINGKYGHSVGDDVVVSCAHMLAKKLRGAKLYRWSGPAFLALFDPFVAVADAEKQAREAAAQQLEKNIEAGDRMVMIVVRISCHVQQISATTVPGELFHKMDALMPAEQAAQSVD